MLYDPPAGEPPPPPRIQRTVNRDGVGGLTLPDFALSNELIAQMPPQLQVLFANRKIERPANLTLNDRPTLGAYYPGGRVQVDRSTDDPRVARHELLHAYSFEAPEYRAEPHMFFGRLMNAANSSDQSVIGPAVNPKDPWHTFVFLAEMALDSPELLPPALQEYFAPLIPTKNQRPGDPK